MVCFKLFGVQVCIHFSLWLMLGALGFYVSYAGMGDWLGIALFVVAGFLCLFMHEMGHALAGRLLGGGKPQIHLAWLGGDCCNEKAVLTRTGGILMTAAGPFASLLLGILVVAGLMLLVGDAGEGAKLAAKWVLGIRPQDLPGDMPPMLALFAFYLLNVSVWWTALNLLPIFPLDGGLLMYGLMKSPIRMHNISLAASSVMTTFFLFAGQWVLMLVMLALAFINYRCLQNMSR